MKARALIAACAALLSAASVHAAGIQQAFLVQNSGWMEPFYTDQQSQLKALVGAVAQAARTVHRPTVSIRRFIFKDLRGSRWTVGSFDQRSSLPRRSRSA